MDPHATLRIRRTSTVYRWAVEGIGEYPTKCPVRRSKMFIVRIPQWIAEQVVKFWDDNVLNEMPGQIRRGDQRIVLNQNTEFIVYKVRSFGCARFAVISHVG